MIALGGVARDELSYKPGKEQLRTQNHRRKCQIEIGRVGNQAVGIAVIEVIQLGNAYHNDCHKPIKNMRLPNSPKKCMGLTPNLEKNQSVIRSR